MKIPIFTHKMILNLLVVFAGVGTIVAVLPVPKSELPAYETGTSVSHGKEMLEVFLVK